MKESALLTVLIDAGLFLSIAALLIPLLKRLKVPNILGYLFAGMLLGPYGLGMFSTQIPALTYTRLMFLTRSR